jgi:hypothetical protein
MTAGSVILFLAYMSLVIYDYSFTVRMTFGAVSAPIIILSVIALEDFRDGFEEAEHYSGITDFFLQL